MNPPKTTEKTQDARSERYAPPYSSPNAIGPCRRRLFDCYRTLPKLCGKKKLFGIVSVTAGKLSNESSHGICRPLLHPIIIYYKSRIVSPLFVFECSSAPKNTISDYCNDDGSSGSIYGQDTYRRYDRGTRPGVGNVLRRKSQKLQCAIFSRF